MKATVAGALVAVLVAGIILGYYGPQLLSYVQVRTVTVVSPTTYVVTSTIPVTYTATETATETVTATVSQVTVSQAAYTTTVTVVSPVTVVSEVAYPVTETVTVTTTVPPVAESLGEAYGALARVLGGQYEAAFVGVQGAGSYLLVGNLPNGSFYVDASHLYYIEGGDYVVAYPPGSGQYWGSLPYDFGVLQLVPDVCGANSALVANTTGLYYGGGNLTVLLVGTFTSYTGAPADGYTVVLFARPPAPPINDTPEYPLYANASMEGWPVQISGGIYYPYSTTPYLVVQWDPYWYYVRDPWTTGEFNVWVVRPTPNGTVSRSDIQLVVGGGGKGFMSVSPGDLILMEVTYDGYDNTIYATVTDLSRSSTVTLALPLYWNFTAPGAGRYWTEVNAGTGNECANWALLYLAELNNAYVQVIKI